MEKVNDKERILNEAREKQSVNYKGTPIRLSADFSTETLQDRRKWQELKRKIDFQRQQEKSKVLITGVPP